MRPGVTARTEHADETTARIFDVAAYLLELQQLLIYVVHVQHRYGQSLHLTSYLY